MDWIERRLPRVERFVQLILAGGIGLVAGLWLLTGFESTTPAWLAGAGLTVAGAVALAVGIRSELDV